MLRVAFETATESCSVAISDTENKQVFSSTVPAKQKQTDLILPMLDALLKESNHRADEIDQVVYGAGPGAFTGVRIATSVAQGIALAAKADCVPVSTLAAMAYATFESYSDIEYCVVLLDARMGELYGAVYQKYAVCKNSCDQHSSVRALIEDSLLSKDISANHNTAWLDLSVLFGNSDTPYNKVAVVGSGVSLIEQFSYLAPLEACVDSNIECGLLSAESLLSLASQSEYQEKAVSPDLALPIYLRNSVAKKPKQA